MPNFDGALGYVKSPLTCGDDLTVLGDFVAPQVMAGLADPGDGVAIPVTDSVAIAITTGAGAETNTVAAPTFLGQRLLLTLDVDGGGDRVITFASAINVANQTIATFATARQTLILEAIQIGGALAWEVTVNNGTVVLS